MKSNGSEMDGIDGFASVYSAVHRRKRAAHRPGGNDNAATAAVDQGSPSNAKPSFVPSLTV